MSEGWLQGKPVTPLIRQLMHHARDQDVIVPDGSRASVNAPLGCTPSSRTLPTVGGPGGCLGFIR